MHTIIIILLINFAANAWANNVVSGSEGSRLEKKLFLNSTALGRCLSLTVTT